MFKLGQKVRIIRISSAQLTDRQKEYYNIYGVNDEILSEIGFLNRICKIIEVHKLNYYKAEGFEDIAERWYRVESSFENTFNIPESLIQPIYTEKDIDRILEETIF